MSEKIKISVIIPVYNAAPYLPRCLDSILLQDYGNLEIICINDGSTDDSGRILALYAQKDSRIRVFNKENGGAAQARNLGLEYVTGDWISFIDADDWIEQGLYSHFARQTESEEFDLFMFNGSIGEKGRFIEEGYFNHKLEADETVDYRSIVGVFYGSSSICNKIFRRGFVEKFKLRFLQGCAFEDIDFYFAALTRAKKIKACFEKYYNYEQGNDNSVTKTFAENAFTLFKIFENMQKTARETQTINYFAYALFQFYYNIGIETLTKIRPDLRRDFYYELKEWLAKEAAKLNPEQYQKLLDYNLCHNILLNEFEDFANTTLLFCSRFNYQKDESSKIRFSIVVPVYNVEPFLETCLKSLINQTFADFEVICVNDGSTDGSLNILEQHAARDGRLHIINQPNRGLSAARNAGAAAAKGDYLLFVDSDDWLRTDALELLNRQLMFDPEDVCIFGWSEYNNQFRCNNPTKYAQGFIDRRAANYKSLKKIAFLHPSAWCKAYRLEFWRKNGFMFPEGMVFEDVPVNAQVMTKAERIAFCCFDLYYYRIRESSIMRSFFSDKKIDDLFTSLKLTYDYLNSNAELRKLLAAFGLFANNALTMRTENIPPEKKEDFIRRIKSSEWLQKCFTAVQIAAGERDI